MTGAVPPEAVDDGDDGADLTAAEYALGVLGQKARAAADKRAETDQAFAASIWAWVLRFESLIGAVAPVEPSAPVWPRIEAAIDRPKAAPVAPAVVSDPEALAAPVAANDASARSLRLWRAWAVGASAVAAVALLFVAVRQTGPGGGHSPVLLAAGGGDGHTLLATLALKETKASAFTVAYDPAQSTLYATPAGDFSIPHARSAELWLIPADGKPRPMGVVDAARPAVMPMPPQFKALAREKATLAISIEPLGGSTTGLPTGPVVATGPLAAV